MRTRYLNSLRSFALFALPALLFACGGKAPVKAKTSEDSEFNRCLRLSSKKHYDEAVDCLEVFKSRYPGSARAMEAELRVGDSYFRKKDYVLAAESYEQFIRLHPSHPQVDYAYYRLGLSRQNALPAAIDRDQSSLGEAIEAFETVWRGYPDSPYAKVALLKYREARGKEGEQAFYVARFYYRTREYKAALPRLAEIAERYGDTELADEALYLQVKSYLALGDIDHAREALAGLAADFAKSAYTQKAMRDVETASKH